jgi:glycosyltransferase involved in cell wall biosynthesis
MKMGLGNPLFDAAFIDVSQFVAEPLRTGVQRVLVKVVEHLPRDRIMPFRVVDAEHVAVLDPALVDIGIRFFRRRALSQRAIVAEAHGKAAMPGEDDWLIKLAGAFPLATIPAALFFEHAYRIVNIEAFSDPARARFYASCPTAQRAKVFHFIHDFLLFESPEAFPQLDWRYASDYVLLFEAWCAAGGYFVSTKAMADKVAHYFNRPRTDAQVVHFGSDLAAPAALAVVKHEGRRSVVVLGTIEPRKYPAIVADALYRLAAYHPELDCTLIGNWGWVDSATRAAIERMLRSGRVQHVAGLADDALAERMRAADVAIYVSSNEGFGLPVIEFAAMGVPVVTNTAVPAASLLADGEAIVLQDVTVASLVTAVQTLLAQVARPSPTYHYTWADCAAEIAEHCEIRSPPAGTPSTVSCWQECARLMREPRQRPATLPQIRAEVRGLSGAAALPKQTLALLTAAMSEVIFEGQKKLQWPDMALAVRPLADLLRAVSHGSLLGGLSDAFVSFLGRPIDAEAAAEAVSAKTPAELLDRIMGVIESKEAAEHLGARAALGFRTVLREVKPMIAMCLAERIDPCLLRGCLGMTAPPIDAVFFVDQMLASNVGHLELLLFLSHGRPVAGDAEELLLEAAAIACLQRGLQISLHAAG